MLYENWCQDERTADRNKTLWRLTELEDGREFVLEELSGRILGHYVSDDEIAGFLEALDFPRAADCIRRLLPTAATGKSGDLGEILAVEFAEERLGYEVPVRRLRFKDHREMAMRGEDVIGVTFDGRDRLKVLKGEAKSAGSLSRATVEEARTRLEEDHGRPSAHSLIFVARQLIKSQDQKMKDLGGAILREAANGEIPKERLAHLLFTLSGNPATNIIQDDFDAADGGREQYSVNLRIEDHGEFVDAVYVEAYEEVASIGDG